MDNKIKVIIHIGYMNIEFNNPHNNQPYNRIYNERQYLTF